MPVTSTDEAKSLAKRWMEDTGQIGEEIPTPEGLKFLLQGKGLTDIPFLILQPTEAKRSIVVVVNVITSEKSLKSFDGMRKKEREEFIWNLKKEIIFAPANFLFDIDQDTSIPKGAQFSKVIYFDELSEGKLAEMVDYTIRSALWMIWTFGKLHTTQAIPDE